MGPFLLGATHLERMDGLLVGYLRRLWKVRHPERREAHLDRAEVVRVWMIAPSAVELRVRRLKAYQRWARCNANHIPGLASLFGQCRLERELGVFRACGDSLSSTPTPWALRFVEDLRDLVQGHDALGHLSDVVEAVSLRFLREGAPEQAEFVAADPHVLRQASWSARIPLLSGSHRRPPQSSRSRRPTGTSPSSCAVSTSRLAARCAARAS